MSIFESQEYHVRTQSFLVLQQRLPLHVYRLLARLLQGPNKLEHPSIFEPHLNGSPIRQSAISRWLDFESEIILTEIRLFEFSR